MRGTIVQINASGGGVPKLPLDVAEVGDLGIIGDDHNDKVNHGGPERALCLYAIERIRGLQQEGHPVAPGTTGENITTEGLDWERIAPGQRLRLGDDVLIELTRFTTPCRFIRESFSDGDFNRMHQNLHPGWSRVYARVIAGGVIRPGDSIELIAAGDGADTSVTVA
jgi:MOSC domain-containing protein YiiM